MVDGETGRLVEQEVDAVTSALRELLGDDDELARMGRAARAKARAATWSGNASRVLELYREALGECAGR